LVHLEVSTVTFLSSATPALTLLRAVWMKPASFSTLKDGVTLRTVELSVRLPSDREAE